MRGPTISAADREALLPCPRCGNKAFIAHGNCPEANGYPVWCLTDRCLRLPPRRNKAEAIAAWNTRRATPSAEAVREACAAVADNHVALGCMSERERDYCHGHGDEIAEKIRALDLTPLPADHIADVGKMVQDATLPAGDDAGVGK